MSGREGDLSSKQKQVLQQLRDNLKDVKLPDDSDYYLLRWLRARSFDLKKSEKMLRDHLKWRIENDIENIMEWDPPEVLVKYFPGGYYGEDKDGYPIWYDTTGRTDVRGPHIHVVQCRGIALSADAKDVIKYKLYAAETSFQKLFPELSKKHGKRIDECSMLFDLHGFSTRFLWKPSADLFIDLLKQLEANYPETLRNAYIINSPKIFSIVFNLLKPFLSEHTKGKIRFCGSDYKQYIQQDINADQIPVHWGGTATDPDGDPFCRSKICMGGEVPQSYYKLNSLKEKANMDEYEQVVIKASSSIFVTKVVEKEESMLRWNFWTEGKDIAFGVKHVSETGENEVVKCERVNSHLLPVHGTHNCDQTGTYVFQFDNKYSWLNAKKLSYQIEVLTPSDKDLPDFVTASTRL